MPATRKAAVVAFFAAFLDADPTNQATLVDAATEMANGICNRVSSLIVVDTSRMVSPLLIGVSPNPLNLDDSSDALRVWMYDSWLLDESSRCLLPVVSQSDEQESSVEYSLGAVSGSGASKDSSMVKVLLNSVACSVSNSDAGGEWLLNFAFLGLNSPPWNHQFWRCFLTSSFRFCLRVLIFSSISCKSMSSVIGVWGFGDSPITVSTGLAASWIPGVDLGDSNRGLSLVPTNDAFPSSSNLST
ncbi:hypothetical protein OGAPHI_005899 [Ogataea philodendri]|uniref:Uncharacterized protein n=1 Tax=Ogataea philodendri TaxID=1378263 RepID=A0A9P8NYS7_9ASCO|nr:uncharacterized protein OGAPHI_005899 [Ogataea philodendri]KAH3661721.1 hypothetical protein OGAPHI_005899 [Ogataea philodendri]